MTLDISLEAIEADLAMAERGGQVATLALARAQVRATLLAVQPVEHQGRHEAAASPVWVNDAGADILIGQGPDSDVFTVPKAATWDDRVIAAAMLLQVPGDILRDSVSERLAAEGADLIEAPTEEDARAGEPEEEAPVGDDDIDADFFAEAKRARKRKK